MREKLEQLSAILSCVVGFARCSSHILHVQIQVSGAFCFLQTDVEAGRGVVSGLLYAASLALVSVAYANLRVFCAMMARNGFAMRQDRVRVGLADENQSLHIYCMSCVVVRGVREEVGFPRSKLFSQTDMLTCFKISFACLKTSKGKSCSRFTAMGGVLSSFAVNHCTCCKTRLSANIGPDTLSRTPEEHVEQIPPPPSVNKIIPLLEPSHGICAKDNHTVPRCHFVFCYFLCRYPARLEQENSTTLL